MEAAENMSKEADRESVSSGDDALSPQPQHQEITVDHGPHMSIDELLKAIKGANGMPVFFVPSGDLENLMSANRDGRQKDLREWLLIVASLIATVTFTAGLSPPGGVWDADDNDKGYVAGTSVMSDKFPTRYRIFQTSIALAFFFSLIIIVWLAKSISNEDEAMVVRKFPLTLLVAACIVSLGTSFIAGTWDSYKNRIWIIVMFVVILVYMSMPWVMSWTLRSKKNELEPKPQASTGILGLRGWLIATNNC